MVTARGYDLGPCADHRSTIGGVTRSQGGETSIIHPAIRIFESLGEKWLQWCARRVGSHVECARRRQLLTTTQMIVQKQAKAQKPGRTHAALMKRQYKAHWMDEMRRIGPQHFALHQRFAHQTELVMLQIAQTTMNELGGARRGATCQIVHLGKTNREATPHGVSCNAASVDAATDYENVEYFIEYFILRHGEP